MPVAVILYPVMREGRAVPKARNEWSEIRWWMLR